MKPNQNVQLKRTSSQNLKKRKKYKRPGFLSSLLFLALIAGIAFFLYKLIILDVLSIEMLMVLAVIITIITLIFHHVWFSKTRRPITRFLCVLLCVIFTGLYGMGGYYLQLTNDMLDNITDITSKQATTITAVVMDDSNIKDAQGLNNKKIALLSVDDATGMEQFQKDLKKANVNAEFVEYSNLFPAASALYDREVDAIALPESMRQTLHETSKFYEFQFHTTDIYKSVSFHERNENSVNYPDPVGSVTSNPFTIYISGNDSYGSMQDTARSDVNMLVTINPNTAEVLITSLPRDSYVLETCKKDENACLPDQYDKLTHTGLDGLAASESTIEDMLDIDINYTARVNFSSLVSLVDAIGGLDIYVEPGLAVEQFWTNPTQGVKEGWNHLDGEGSLAFSRERYAYEDGDLQRIKNQQIVIKAIIQKILSPSMFMHYPEFIDALSVAFETNLTSDDIKSLIRFQLTHWPNWNIENYAVAGTVSDAYCAKLEDYASVTHPYEEMIQAAHDKIEAVLQGRKASDIPDPVIESADAPTENGDPNAQSQLSEEDQEAAGSGDYWDYYGEYAPGGSEYQEGL